MLNASSNHIYSRDFPEGIERVKFIERLTVEEYINYCGSSSGFV